MGHYDYKNGSIVSEDKYENQSFLGHCLSKIKLIPEKFG